MIKNILVFFILTLSLLSLHSYNSASEVISSEIKTRGSEILIPIVEKGDEIRLRFLDFNALQDFEFNTYLTDDYQFLSLSTFFVNEYMMPPPFYYLGFDYNNIKYGGYELSSVTLAAQPFPKNFGASFGLYPSTFVLGTLLLGPVVPISSILSLAGIDYDTTWNVSATFVWGDSTAGMPSYFYDLAYELDNGFTQKPGGADYTDMDEISFMDFSQYNYLETPYGSLGYHYSPLHPFLGGFTGGFHLYGYNTYTSFFNDIYFDLNPANIIIDLARMTPMRHFVDQYGTELIVSLERYYDEEDNFKGGAKLVSFPVLGNEDLFLLYYNFHYHNNLYDVEEETHLFYNALVLTTGGITMKAGLQSRSNNFESWVYKYRFELAVIISEKIRLTAQMEMDDLPEIIPDTSNILDSAKAQAVVTYFY
jgi:hypothetical protein